MLHTDCRHFTGYKPCRFKRACVDCPHYSPLGSDILLINLDAMGDVLRTTAVLPAIRRAWPDARLTWLTRRRAAPLLANNPLIDRVLTLDSDALAELGGRRFDVLLNVDKSPVSGGLAISVQAGDKRGFGISPAGAIVPLGAGSSRLYELGLDDDLKFRVNQRCEQDLLAEAFGLSWERDEYSLALGEEERAAGPGRKVGFNTGCAPAYPYKKLPLSVQARAIRRIGAWLGEPVLLLGGPEDTARNTALAAQLGGLVELTPTEQGLRRGLAEVDRCEVVVSGDSLGMHMAIALKKHVVAWFGPTCPQEIELYGRGVKLRADVSCAPCWRPSCEREPKCYDRVEPVRIEQAVRDCLDARAGGRTIDELR